MGGRFSKNKKKTGKSKRKNPDNENENSNLYKTPTEIQQQVEKPDFQAMFDYDKNGSEDISIRKHDLLKLLINE